MGVLLPQLVSIGLGVGASLCSQVLRGVSGLGFYRLRGWLLMNSHHGALLPQGWIVGV